MASENIDFLNKEILQDIFNHDNEFERKMKPDE